MKIVFWGTSEFSVPALKKLGSEVVAVVTVPDQPTGRKKVMTAPPLKTAALQLGLQVLQPESLKDDAFFETFQNLNPDLCVVAAYGKIIPQRYLELPKHEFINIHPSLLPKYRGPTPIQSAILNGDKETGVTIMKLDAGMDTGPILSQIKYELDSEDAYETVCAGLAKWGAKLLFETIPEYVAGNIKPKPQDSNGASLTKIFKREDGKIDWSQSPEKISAMTRALNPEPGTWTIWKDKVLNIKLAFATEGKLKIMTVQLEGKKETTFADLLHAHPDFKIEDLK